MLPPVFFCFLFSHVVFALAALSSLFIDEAAGTTLDLISYNVSFTQRNKQGDITICSVVNIVSKTPNIRILGLNFVCSGIEGGKKDFSVH